MSRIRYAMLDRRTVLPFDRGGDDIEHHHGRARRQVLSLAGEVAAGVELHERPDNRITAAFFGNGKAIGCCVVVTYVECSNCLGCSGSFVA